MKVDAKTGDILKVENPDDPENVSENSENESESKSHKNETK